MSNSIQTQRLLELCKAIGNETRYQIILLLRENTQFCGDLVTELGMAQSTVSHHLKILRNAGIVLAEDRGSWVCYRLNPEVFEELQDIVSNFTQK